MASPAFVTFSFLKEHYDMISAQVMFDSIAGDLKEAGYEVADIRAKESLNTKIWFITDIIRSDNPNQTPVTKDLYDTILSQLKGYDAREEGGVVHIGGTIE